MKCIRNSTAREAIRDYPQGITLLQTLQQFAKIFPPCQLYIDQ